jgi:hypothetical protein
VEIMVRILRNCFLLCILLLGLLFAYIFIDFDEGPPLNQTSPTVVNDITRLNPIEVTRVVQPNTIGDIVKAIKSSSGPISIGGGRFSQGGQTAYPDSLHIDMRTFNKVLNLDVSKKQVTVQSGITWRDLQEVIDECKCSWPLYWRRPNY